MDTTKSKDYLLSYLCSHKTAGNSKHVLCERDCHITTPINKIISVTYEEKTQTPRLNKEWSGCDTYRWIVQIKA